MDLRQSTAVVIPFGPFVSPTDGVTLQTGLVSAIDHASTGIMLSKNGGALAVRHASVTASTYDAYGNYLVTLDTTDTATLGALRVQFAAAASCAPVWQDFDVITAVEWDRKYATSGGNLPNAVAGASGGVPLSVDASGRVDVLKINGTSQTATDLGAALALVQADLPTRVTKNVALAAFPFFMADSSDHVSGKTGLTITATRSIDGAAFGACANSATEISAGWYKIDLAAADLNGNTIAFKFTATGADPTNFTVVTQPT